MVTFQNTEQRHKKYIKQTIIDKFKVVFSETAWKLLNHFWNIRVSIDSYFFWGTVRERFVNCFIFYFYGSDRIAADVRKLLSLPW
jgi:hypothetical protein